MLFDLIFNTKIKIWRLVSNIFHIIISFVCDLNFVCEHRNYIIIMPFGNFDVQLSRQNKLKYCLSMFEIYIGVIPLNMIISKTQVLVASIKRLSN